MLTGGTPQCRDKEAKYLCERYEFSRGRRLNSIGSVKTRGRIMLSLVLALILGFAGGYGTREWISRRRRAAAREEYFRRQQEKEYRDYALAHKPDVSAGQNIGAPPIAGEVIE